jgi:hypothetical protein
MLWLLGGRLDSRGLNTIRFYIKIGGGEVVGQDEWKMQDGRYL